MKTIKAGSPPRPDLNFYWWIGKHLTCGTCGGVYELEYEDADALTVTQERCPNGKRRVAGDCPNCRSVIAYEESPIARQEPNTNLPKALRV